MSTDRWGWATVTQVSPLRIRLDGEAGALPVTPVDLTGGVGVGDRVRVHMSGGSEVIVAGSPSVVPAGPNLIVNGDFRINQRGAASGASVASSAYFLDRWKNVSGGTRSPSWSTSGGATTLTITGDASFATSIRQVVEANALQAGEYTLSWEGTAPGTILETGGSGSYQTSPITLTVSGETTLDVQFRVDPAASGTIRNVRLERGRAATPFASRPHGEELALCHRYYQRFGGVTGNEKFAGGMTVSDTSARFLMHLRRSMRSATPTLAYASLQAFDGSVVSAVSALTVATPGSPVLQLTATVSGMTAFRPAELLANGSSAYIALDAEL